MQDDAPYNDLFSHLPALHRKLGSNSLRTGGLDACKLLIVGAPGFEGEAVVACVALQTWMTHCSCHDGLTHLLQQDPSLMVGSLRPMIKSCFSSSPA